MTWQPISNTPIQYQASDGSLANGYYLKFYASGTTTPINMAIDAAASAQLAKCQINSSGYPINGSSAVFIPHIDQDYKIVLYQNATDADANTFGNADWIVDALSPNDTGLRGDLASTALDDGTKGANIVYYPLHSAENSLAITPVDYHYPVASFKRYATGDGVTDDTTGCQNALDVGNTAKIAVLVQAGNYLITSPLVINASQGVIYGEGRRSVSRITKSTNTTGTGTQAARSGTITDSYVVDSILSIKAADNTYAYDVVIRDLDLISTAASTVDYAIYAPRTARLNLSNIYTQNCDYGFYTFDSWQSTIDGLTSDTCISVLAYVNDTSGNATGTSLTASRIYANTCTIGFDLFGLQYSTFNSCASDHASNIAYKLNTCTGITMNTCGAEDVDGGTVLNVASSKLVVNSFQAYRITGVTGKGALAFDGSSTDVVLNSCNFPDFDSISGTDYNLLVSGGAMVTAFNTTFPTNGNTFSSYSSGAVLYNYSDGAVTRTDSTGSLPYMQRETETAPTLAASWTSVVGREIVYYREGEHIYMNGAVTGGTTTNATVVFTLNAGYRPAKEQYRQATFSNGSVFAPCTIRIQTDGKVQIYNVTANNELTLGGIVFKSPS